LGRLHKTPNSNFKAEDSRPFAPGQPEYISKKCVFVNQKAELKGKLEAFEHNRQNRFEPAIRFILEAKQATILLAEGNQEKNRDFLKKIGSNFQMA
jgi:hypothetical protein